MNTQIWFDPLEFTPIEYTNCYVQIGEKEYCGFRVGSRWYVDDYNPQDWLKKKYPNVKGWRYESNEFSDIFEQRNRPRNSESIRSREDLCFR